MRFRDADLDIIDRGAELSRLSRAVVVRAIDGDVEAHWKSSGFIPSTADASMLFRSIDDIAAWPAQTASTG